MPIARLYKFPGSMCTLKLFVKLFIIVSWFPGLVSCIRDVDIDQAEEIVIPPTAALDLVYFTLDSSHFVPQPSSGVVMARDEVRLEFLDDDYIRNGLVRADYNFIYINTFSESFTNTITFLSENNAIRYVIRFDIPAGSSAEPAVINYTEIIDSDEIQAIRESIKMVISIESQSNSLPATGELQLKSKAFYQFEFK